ncbi:MAG: RDD family protein [Bradymonadales bacterium]|nr:RDD family protein [Bradymonadales bacterium]
MPLSARRAGRRPVQAQAVGLPTRTLSALLDCLLPSLSLLAMIWAGALDLGVFRAGEGIFAVDQILERLYRQPGRLLSVPMTWMLLWTAFSLAMLGTVHTTLGKKLLGLSLVDGRGQTPSGLRLLLRIAAGWLVPLSLGLAFLWIVISPQRRSWPDLLSGTFVVRQQREGK